MKPELLDVLDPLRSRVLVASASAHVADLSSQDVTSEAPQRQKLDESSLLVIEIPVVVRCAARPLRRDENGFGSVG